MVSAMPKKLFCFGYGYTANYLGYALQNNQKASDQWTLAGTVRTEDKRQTLQNSGIDVHIFDSHTPLANPAAMLKDTTHLLISIPPGDEGDPAFLTHAADIAKIPTLEWVGYLSTTGVYGDRQGQWVDETTIIRPTSRRGKRRALAENQWASLVHNRGLPTHIFRLAGIYGPGRSALDSIRAGVARRIDKPGQAFSRIHVEDIVETLIASINTPNAGQISNVCDDYPSPSHEVFAHACELLRRPVPALIPFDQADMAPMARSFYADNKRVHNKKIKDELQLTLKYPSY